MTRRERIEALAAEAVERRVFPGCAIGYVRGGETQLVSSGRLTYDSAAPAVGTDTLYDVASVTKSIPTAGLALKLVEEGRLSLDQQVVELIPELDNAYREQILVRHLLTYTVVFDLPHGLAAVAKARPDDLLEVILRTPLLAPPDDRYHYTNVPAILLGMVIERLHGRPLDEVAQEAFFAPLGMERTTFRPERLHGAVVAPTEIDWRGEVCGVAHDEAAWVLRQRGMVAGHAGLFSTAQDLLKFAQMLLAEGTWEGRRYFAPETVRSMHTNQLGSLRDKAGLGWEVEQPMFMGSQGSTLMFGKTGFTGCLVLVDPAKQVAMVHLSNRTYPERGRDRAAIHTFRRGLADLVFGD